MKDAGQESAVILEVAEYVTLIGGAEVAPALLADVVTRAPVVVAADGGAVPALAQGILPEAVIGDFDSLPEAVRAEIPPGRLHHIAEQDSTDFEKCLRNVSAPLFLGVGFSDGRFDHQLATCTALCRYARQSCILVGQHDLMFLTPPCCTLDLARDTRISLFPMGDVTGTSQGLAWPIDGLRLSPTGRIATSNRATGPVQLNVDAPLLLTILPAECLDIAIAALTHAATWEDAA